MALASGELDLFQSQANPHCIGQMRNDGLNQMCIGFVEIRLPLHSPDDQKGAVTTLAKRHGYKTVVTSVGTDHLIVIRRVTIGLVKPQTLGPV